VRLNLAEDCCSSLAWINGGRDFAYIRGGADRSQVLVLKSGETSTVSGDEFESVLPVGIGALESVTPSKIPNMLYLLIENGVHNEVLKFNSEQKAFQTMLPGLTADYIAFSKDGKWMAYVDKEQQLWRSRLDGTDALLVSKGFKSVQLSAWSPDGNRLAFMGMKPGKSWRIYIVDRDGVNVREAAEGEGNQGAPTWSQDGKKIVYGDVLCAETQTCWIRVIDLESGTIEKLPGSHDFRTARWSPDGKYIAARVPASDQLVLYDVKTHHWRLLADGVTGDTISWSFDGKTVYADSPQKEEPVIESFRISDGKRVTVVSLSDLQKISGQMEFWFGLTPDKSIILIHRSAASEIYSLEFEKN
jgi:sugar lactone lactonase YvrE